MLHIYTSVSLCISIFLLHKIYSFFLINLLNYLKKKSFLALKKKKKNGIKHLQTEPFLRLELKFYTLQFQELCLCLIFVVCVLERFFKILFLNWILFGTSLNEAVVNSFFNLPKSLLVFLFLTPTLRSSNKKFQIQTTYIIDPVWLITCLVWLIMCWGKKNNNNKKQNPSIDGNVRLLLCVFPAAFVLCKSVYSPCRPCQPPAAGQS